MILSSTGSASIIAVFAVSIALLAIIFGIPDRPSPTLERELHRSDVAIMRSNLMALINNDRSWANTINDPTNSALKTCLENPCSTSTSYNDLTVLKDPANRTIDARCGLLGKTESCLTSHQIRWRTLCPTAVPCTNPTVQFTVSITGHSKSAANMRSLDFVVAKE